jgi:hypothetical protein
MATSIDTLSAVAAVLLAISLAAERLVTAVKAMIPWLAEEADEAKNPDGTTDRKKDRPRRVIVVLIAFLAAWLTTALAAGGSFFGSITIAELSFPIPLVALLASGGSAWWTNIVAYASAAKDARANEALATPQLRPSRLILNHPDVLAVIEKVRASS